MSMTHDQRWAALVDATAAMREHGWSWGDIHDALDVLERTEDVPPPPMGEVQQAWAVAMWDTLRDGAIREEPEALMRMR